MKRNWNDSLSTISWMPIFVTSNRTLSENPLPQMTHLNRSLAPGLWLIRCWLSALWFGEILPQISHVCGPRTCRLWTSLSKYSTVNLKEKESTIYTYLRCALIDSLFLYLKLMKSDVEFTSSDWERLNSPLTTNVTLQFLRFTVGRLKMDRVPMFVQRNFSTQFAHNASLLLLVFITNVLHVVCVQNHFLAIRTFAARMICCEMFVERLSCVETFHTKHVLTFELFDVMGLLYMSFQWIQRQKMHFAHFALKRIAGFSLQFQFLLCRFRLQIQPLSIDNDMRCFWR